MAFHNINTELISILNFYLFYIYQRQTVGQNHKIFAYCHLCGIRGTEETNLSFLWNITWCVSAVLIFLLKNMKLLPQMIKMLMVSAIGSATL